MKIKSIPNQAALASEIIKIVNRGNQCEIKLERDKLVVVEIRRQVVIKHNIIAIGQ